MWRLDPRFCCPRTPFALPEVLKRGRAGDSEAKPRRGESVAEAGQRSRSRGLVVVLGGRTEEEEPKGEGPGVEVTT